MDIKQYTSLRVTRKTRNRLNKICALEQKSADGVIDLLLSKYYGELTDEKIIKRIREDRVEYAV